MKWNQSIGQIESGDGAVWKEKGSPKLLQFILRETWNLVRIFMYPFKSRVEVFHSKPQMSRWHLSVHNCVPSYLSSRCWDIWLISQIFDLLVTPEEKSADHKQCKYPQNFMAVNLIFDEIFQSGTTMVNRPTDRPNKHSLLPWKTRDLSQYNTCKVQNAALFLPQSPTGVLTRCRWFPGATDFLDQ